MTGALQTLLDQPGDRLIVLDGGLGTTLRDTFKQDVSGAVWSSKLLFEDPEVIYKAHLAFLESGADVILTGTYQADVSGFVALGYGQAEAEDKMRLAVELALRARDTWVASAAFETSGRKPPAVGLSLGSYGALLLNGEEFSGKYPADQQIQAFLADFHQRRLSVFAPLIASIDVIAFETVPLAAEVAGIRQAMTDLAAGGGGAHAFGEAPFYIGLTCPSGAWADAGGLAAGRKALWEGDARRPFGVALNCTEAQSLAALIPGLAPDAPLPSAPTLVLYPNHNVRFLDDAAYWDEFSAAKPRKETSAEWAAALVQVAQAALGSGKWARKAVVGGCCGTGLDEIAVLRATVDETPA